MIDTDILFKSLKASWVTKLLNADPTAHNWLQLPYVHYRFLLDYNANLRFNFESSVGFEGIDSLPPFHKEVFKCYKEVFVDTLESFKENINSQCIWGNKFICVKRKK